jgi:dipeptidase E
MTRPRRILLLSASTVHGGGYLEYCRAELGRHFDGLGPVLFLPYARPGGISHEDYAERTRAAFREAELELEGIHDRPDPVGAIREAPGLFIGGGNTFLLLRELYRNGLLEPIRDRVAEGVPYLGSSAGSNVAGLTIGTTNDMPIVFPPSFDALGLVRLNINPHYLDPDPRSTHMGETRETRIREFHHENPQPVLGLREGAWLSVLGDVAAIGGSAGARLFRRGAEPVELAPGAQPGELIGI